MLQLNSTRHMEDTKVWTVRNDVVQFFRRLYFHKSIQFQMHKLFAMLCNLHKKVLAPMYHQVKLRNVANEGIVQPVIMAAKAGELGAASEQLIDCPN